MRRLLTAGATGARRPAAGEGGFVLLEVLVTMTVLSVGIMAVLTGVLSALDLQKDAAMRYRAGLILQEKLAETALTPYDGQPGQGLSADGVFSWSVSGEPWGGAPRFEQPRRDPKSEEEKEQAESLR